MVKKNTRARHISPVMAAPSPTSRGIRSGAGLQEEIAKAEAVINASFQAVSQDQQQQQQVQCIAIRSSDMWWVPKGNRN